MAIAWQRKTEYGDYPSVCLRDGIVWGLQLADRIIAVDLATGTDTGWFAPTKQAVYGCEVTDDAVFFTSGQKVYAAGRAGGESRWAVDVGTVFAPPVVAGALVLTQLQAGPVIALDAATGAER